VSAAGSMAVELVGVSKRFADAWALRDVDIRIAPGEVVALLGPNGAGKSTAIALMTGLRTPTAGAVRVYGDDPRSQRARSRMGVMLQHANVPQNLRVRELVELFRSCHAAPIGTRALLERAGLLHRARKSAGTLSFGERRRLLFALALAGDPEILFLDEPTAALDAASRAALLDTLRGLARAGRTIVLTTHDLTEAEGIAGRVLVLANGRLVMNGTLEELRLTSDVTLTRNRHGVEEAHRGRVAAFRRERMS